MIYRTVRDLPTEEYFAPGHGLCAGCPIGTLAKIALKVSGKDTIVVNATGCAEVSTTLYPLTSWKVPWIHLAFENAAATASGVRAAYNAMRKKGLTDKDVNVIVFAGDGGTADIGLQALSGALERGDKFLYICYDNEAYMNTGIQRSGATPFGAWTTTTPLGAKLSGREVFKKDLIGIAIAHNIKYAATAVPSYPFDLANKIEKGLKVNGPAFLHVLIPCTTGWRFDPSLTIKIGKLAVQTGLWPLYEYENGTFRVTVPIPRRKPVIEYLKLQGRFKHLLDKPELIAQIQKYADELAQRFGLGPLEEQK